MIQEIAIPAYLNPTSIADLLRQLNEIEKSDTRFVILKGSENTFCKGLDLKWVTENPNGSYMKEMQDYGAFLKKLQTGSFISIALVNGAAAGGGMGIVCAADYVIASEKSTFSLPEGLLGLIPGMIMPALLNRLTAAQVKKMVFTGQAYSVEIAEKWSFIDEIVITSDLNNAVQNAVQKMKSCKKDPIGDLKKLLYNSHIYKDELAQEGMNILAAKLKEEEIIDRLTAIADFME